MPSVVIAESNKRFEIAMYVGMLVVGLGLVVYMAMTGNLKPKPDADEAAPAAVDTDNAVDGTPVKPEDIGIPETADDEVDIVEP
ncbi:MAG: hypothetical protein HKN47_00495 [Pirellulaceae bacterium]|nr:hypothetical protein [Pirellulaceae bacterium]